MKTIHPYKIIGFLLIVSSIALLVPYTTLTMIFDYPNILRFDTATILTRFHEGGPSLIWTWFAFAITGVPLIPAYVMLGQQLEDRARIVRVATTIGVISLVVQMVGLLRWTFVVPVLADTFVNANDEATRASAIIAFNLIHQFAGVILGEHLGQLFTVAWTVLMTITFIRIKLMPTWVNVLGLISAVIYFIAQGELFATVMPDFPVWDLAGFLGSTLWLIWMIILGSRLVKIKSAPNSI